MPAMSATSGAATDDLLLAYAKAVLGPQPIGTASAAGALPFRLLRRIQAIVFETSALDDEAVRQSGGYVVPNTPVGHPTPVSTTTGGTPDLWHLTHINAPRLQGGATGQGTRIGILDTGIDPSHTEFAGRLVAFEEFNARGLPISGTARDAGVHGTHVSGLVGGATAGVAPSVELAVAAVLTVPHGGRLVGYPSQIASGLDWLAAQDVHIINASLGAYPRSRWLYQAIKSLRDQDDVLTIAAVGNSGANGAGNHGSPGDYDLVVSVGAVDDTDEVADFSDWCPQAQQPDVCAPGVQVWSALPGNAYGAMDGTSMAAPVVAGAAAVVREQLLAAGRASAADDIEAALRASVVTATPADRAGGGRIHFS